MIAGVFAGNVFVILNGRMNVGALDALWVSLQSKEISGRAEKKWLTEARAASNLGRFP